MSKLLKAEDVAEMLHVTTRTLYDWLRTGRIPGRKIGKSWLISEEALQQYLNSPLPPSVLENAEAKTIDSELLSSPILAAKGEEDRSTVIDALMNLCASSTRSTDDFLALRRALPASSNSGGS